MNRLQVEPLLHLLEARSSAIKEVECFKKGKDDLKIITVEWPILGPNEGYSSNKVCQSSCCLTFVMLCLMFLYFFTQKFKDSHLKLSLELNVIHNVL